MSMHFCIFALLCCSGHMCWVYDNAVVVPSSIVYSHTCSTTALTNISTCVSPHVWLYPMTNATSHVPTRMCGLMLSTHAYPCHVPNEMHLSPSSTPSSASAFFVHICYTTPKMIVSEWDSPKARYSLGFVRECSRLYYVWMLWTVPLALPTDKWIDSTI